MSARLLAIASPSWTNNNADNVVYYLKLTYAMFIFPLIHIAYIGC